MKKKQTFWGALIGTMVLLLVPAIVWADSAFGGGWGTEQYPYLIKTRAHFNQLATDVKNGNTYKDKYFRMEADIDYGGYSFYPVGTNFFNDQHAFSGTFDGNGHSISNVSYTGGTYNNGQGIGLFGYVSEGTIKNLTLAGKSVIKGYHEVGGIVGIMTCGRILNCHTKGDVTIGPYNYNCQNLYGGIVGWAGAWNDNRDEDYGYLEIDGCTNEATVTNGGYNQCGRVGGVVGYLTGQNSSRGKYYYTVLSNCYNYGKVSGNESVGGVVSATNISTSNGSGVYDCANLASVSGNSYVGGIVGRDYNGNANSAIHGCYLGGNYTIAAVGVEGSSTGTDEGIDAKHIGTLNILSYVDATLITQPTVILNGTDYYAERTQIQFSELSTSGTVASGKVWGFQAKTPDNRTVPILEMDNGVWQFTMPKGNVTISTRIGTDINGTTITVDRTSRFTAKAQVPNISLWDRKAGKQLVLGTDYVTDRSESGYTAKGTYTIHIWGIGDYGGKYTYTYTITNPWEGEGTMYNPFLIASTDDLDLLEKLVDMGNDYTNTYFRQTANLDYQGKRYQPIGDRTHPFNGTYDGYFYTISNVTIGGTDYSGLFGCVDRNGEVRSVVLGGENTISGRVFVGGIVAMNLGNLGLCGIEEGASVVVMGIAISGGGYVGGYVGYNMGQVYGNWDCRAEVSCWAKREACVGGIVGLNNGGEVGDTFIGSISARGYVGGVVGKNQNFGTVHGLNKGNIQTEGGDNTVGGVVGLNTDGGIVMHSTNVCLMNDVQVATYAGGVVGQNDGGVLENNYYIGDCSFGGINGTDVKGQAMRGYPIATDERVRLFPWPNDEDMMVGTYYDDGTNNYYYVGEGEELRFVMGTEEPLVSGYTANGEKLPLVGTSHYGDNIYSLTMVADLMYVEPLFGILGDVNDDGTVNISDVTALVNIILGKSVAPNMLGDVNQDGNIDISDVTALVNIILGK